MKIDLNKSISELDNWKWKSEIPDENSGGIVTRLYELHNKPITEIELGDIRFLIGQNVGLNHLVPIALGEVRQNIFIETEYYPGDLLHALFSINNTPNYWDSHSKEKQELVDLYTENKKIIGTLNLTQEIIVELKEAFNRFVG